LLSSTDEFVFALEVLRDLLGLVGSILVAVPFFLFEHRKHRAHTFKTPRTNNAELVRIYGRAHTIMKDAVIRPFKADSLICIIGICLISASFAVSLGTTIYRHEQPAVPATRSVAPNGS
jgi:hypothetical protein